jgi:NAD-dependent SIR2 family protein deacetylase
MNEELNEDDFVEMFYGVENDDIIHVCGATGELAQCVDCAKMVNHWNYNYLGYNLCDDCMQIEAQLEMNIVRGQENYDED